MIGAYDIPDEYLIGVNEALKPVFVQWQRMMNAQDLHFWATAMMMHGVAVDQLKGAALYWMANRKWMPQPIELVELVKGQSSGNRWLVALKELRRLIGEIGPYRTPSIEDPVLRKTIEDFGGWKEMCETEENTDFFERRFMQAYENNRAVTPVLGASNQVLLSHGASECEQLGLLTDTPGGR